MLGKARRPADSFPGTRARASANGRVAHRAAGRPCAGERHVRRRGSEVHKLRSWLERLNRPRRLSYRQASSSTCRTNPNRPPAWWPATRCDSSSRRPGDRRLRSLLAVGAGGAVRARRRRPGWGPQRRRRRGPAVRPAGRRRSASFEWQACVDSLQLRWLVALALSAENRRPGQRDLTVVLDDEQEPRLRLPLLDVREQSSASGLAGGALLPSVNKAHPVDQAEPRLRIPFCQDSTLTSRSPSNPGWLR